MVASFEQATPMTMSAMLVQYTSDQHIGQHDDFDEAYDELTSRVMFFDSMVRANPDDLIATMTIAHKQMGVEEFVVDNGMTLDVDRQDNTAQAAVADKLRVFAAQYPVVLHIVLHPRKPPPSEASKPPSTADIMGASEWAAMAHNIICVWRDVAKSQRLSEMRDEGMDHGEIMAFDESCPDGKVFVRKQRDSGDLPMTSYRFDKETKRAWKTFDDMAPYWSPGAIHEEEQEEPE
jgi:twinkle protein